MPNVEPSVPAALRAGVLTEPSTEGLDQAHTLRLLEHTRAYPLDPRHWTQGAVARNSQGREVEPDAPEVASRCLAGTLYWFGRCVHPRSPAAAYLHAGILLDSVLPEVFPPHQDYVVWQDRPPTTHAQVLRLLEATVARARARANVPAENQPPVPGRDTHL